MFTWAVSIQPGARLSATSRIETEYGEMLSPLNEIGVNGAGAAGAIPVGPLFAQALEDALYDVDFEILEIPLNSNRLWELVNSK